MIAKVQNYIRENKLFQEGDVVLTGVSGGADSICLLCMLKELVEQKLLPVSLYVVHVNHGLRESAGADEDYVRRICAKWEIPFYHKKVDVKSFAAGQHLSTEEAARILRYRAIGEVKTQLQKQEKKPVKIAVAHTMDDNAETILFHLFRGTGMRGLTGMKGLTDRKDLIGTKNLAETEDFAGIGVQQGEIVRPLLCLQRREVEEYLAQRRVDFCQDETNNSLLYARNRIRHKIIPQAVMVNEQAVLRINEMSRQMTLAEDFMQTETDRAYENCCREEREDIIILENEFLLLHPYLQQRLVMSVCAKVTGGAKDIHAVHIHDILHLFHLQSGRRICLPRQCSAYRIYEGIRISREKTRDATPARAGNMPVGRAGCASVTRAGDMTVGEPDHAPVPLPINGDIDWDGYHISTRVFPYTKESFPKEMDTKWFDYDKIVETPVLRHRQEGDYLMLEEMGSRQKLKSFFINEKVPAKERDGIPLLAAGKEILWIYPLRMSASAKVGDTTKRILEVRWKNNG
ncbi:MAG: tRNA lysidine(34) synthetase TilS [Lachnospiraceae bacterium]